MNNVFVLLLFCEAAVILALAAMDGVLSIWVSTHPVPLLLVNGLVAENCFITDLAWTQDGNALAFSTSSGQVGSLSIGWGPLLQAAAWSAEELSQWRCKRHMQITQPAWDLPSAPGRGSLQAKPGSQGSRPSMYYIQDLELRKILQGHSWGPSPAAKASGVLDVDSCIEGKLQKSWRRHQPVKPSSPPRSTQTEARRCFDMRMQTGDLCPQSRLASG